MSHQHIGHMGTGFYGSNDPTNSVKALKEDRSKGSGFNPIRSTPPCSHWYNNYSVWNIKTQIHASRNKSTHSEMGPVWQNPNQRTVRTAHLSVLMTVHNFTTYLICPPLSRFLACFHKTSDYLISYFPALLFLLRILGYQTRSMQ